MVHPTGCAKISGMKPLHGARPAAPESETYVLLRDAIIAGDLAPEAHLSEPELAQRLGVSRTPVREALRTLLAEGLAVRTPSGRAVVAPVSVQEIRDIYDVRSRLEGLVAAGAARHVGDTDRERMEDMVGLMERLSDRTAEVTRIGQEFHASLEAMAGNPMCSAMILTLRGHMDRYRAMTAREPERAAAAVREHRSIWEAVDAGDPERAEKVMRAHVDEAGRAACALVEQQLGGS